MKTIKELVIPVEDRDTLLDRIKSRCTIDESTGCWLWHGWNDGGGYGKVRYKGMAVYTHRATYLCVCGPIPEGRVLDHNAETCGNRNCCNPDHLEPVTCRENLYRGGWVNHKFGGRDEREV